MASVQLELKLEGQFDVIPQGCSRSALGYTTTSMALNRIEVTAKLGVKRSLHGDELRFPSTVDPFVRGNLALQQESFEHNTVLQAYTQASPALQAVF